MARKGAVAIQESLETNEDFENYLDSHSRELVCLEIYSEFCGYCLATVQAIRKGKLEIGGDRIVMAKIPADNVEALSRFRGRSEPTFMFIARGRVVRLFYGANGVQLCNIIAQEVELFKREEEPKVVRRKGYEVNELLPEEAMKMEEERRIAAEEAEKLEQLRRATLGARKRRVCERLSKHLPKLNFIMFWPHCHRAHYDLYETMDNLEIQVAAKEQYELDDKAIEEVLYLSDVELNEACMHALTSGPVLVVLYKMQDSDTRDFVKLLRQALYEEIPEPKENEPPEKQLPPIPAFDRYSTISKTKREIRRMRYEENLAKLRKEKEEQARLEAEMARIAREEAEERERQEQKKKEEERMARLQAGLPASPEPEIEEGEEELEGEGKGEIEEEEEGKPEEAPEEEQGEEAEEKVEEEEEYDSGISIEGEEYIPPPDLLVPGFYAPPNQLAKANALAYLFPKVKTGRLSLSTLKGSAEKGLKGLYTGLYSRTNFLEPDSGLLALRTRGTHRIRTIVLELAPIESEFLPPHMLMMFAVDKRHEIGEIINQFADDVLNVSTYWSPYGSSSVHTLIDRVGFFFGEDVFEMEHIAFSIKQYDKMVRPYKHKDRLAVMVSRKRSLALLQLAGLNPCYISADVTSGEKECLQLFPVGYGDDYIEVDSKQEVAKKKETAPTSAPETKKTKGKKQKKTAELPADTSEGAAEHPADTSEGAAELPADTLEGAAELPADTPEGAAEPIVKEIAAPDGETTGCCGYSHAHPNCRASAWIRTSASVSALINADVNADADVPTLGRDKKEIGCD
ncbi:Thioredoxin domain-containing protein 6 [Eumeta japonica]|uniref:Thioredoxin domain-containing protein 6 n=1 Tax=Eumeta variegata TaxID=151549 RepID=A0A4C1ZTB0_EUMVA|nr:Thioredoxin domain-containing protein 6 [Eumeta japonica]